MAKDFEVKFKIGGALASSFGSAFNGASKTVGNFGKSIDATKKKLQGLQDISKKGLMFAGAGAAALVVPVKLAIDYESAMADVKKVVDFDTPEQFKQMGDDVIRLSTKLPMAAKDIAAIVAAGGQSGIEKSTLLQFAEDAVKMGVAFDITAEESGQAMAEMRTAFRMSQGEVTELADKINYLGNNTPAAAKGIMEIVQRIGPLGEVGGFASGSIAALGATIRGMGVAEEVAATGIKNMMLALVAGESATKSQQAAYAKLGLESGAVAKAMQKDSEKTTLTVLKAVSKLGKYEQAATLKNLFGSESLGSIAPLLTNMEALEKNLGMVGDKTKYAGSMQAEYDARAATTANSMKLFKNQIEGLAITFGSTLLPTINQLLEKTGGVVEKFMDWAKANPELVEKLTKIAVVAVAIVGGLSALSIGLIAVVGPIMMVAKSFGVVMTAVRLMSAALLMNPIGLIITGIAVAATLIYTYWEPISGFFSGIWTSIKGFFSSGIANISAAIVNWSPLGLFYQAFSAVFSWFGVDMPAKFTEFGKNLIMGLINGIGSMVGVVVDKAKSIAGAITGAVKNAFQINSPSKLFTQFGAYNMQGLANGMENNAGLPQRAATDAAYGTIPSMPKNSTSLAPSGGSGGATLQLTQYITVGSGDAAAQAKQGAASGAQDMLSAFDDMMKRKERLKF